MSHSARPSAAEGSPLGLLRRLCSLVHARHPALRALLQEQSVEEDLSARLRIEQHFKATLTHGLRVSPTSYHRYESCRERVDLALGRPGLAAELVELGVDPAVAHAVTTYASAPSLAELEAQVLSAEDQRPGVLAAWACVAALAESYADHADSVLSMPAASNLTSPHRNGSTVLGLFGPHPTP